MESRYLSSEQHQVVQMICETKNPDQSIEVTVSVNLEFVVLSIEACKILLSILKSFGCWGEMAKRSPYNFWVVANFIANFFLQRILYHHPADVQLVARPCDGLPERLLQGPLLPADQTLPQASAPGREEQRSWVRHKGPVRDPSVADQPHQETGGRELWWSVER